MDFAYALAHYFFPRHSNNQKAKILHSSTLLIITLFLVFYQVVLQVLPLSGVRILGYGANISVSDVVSLTNQKRAEAGLTPLEYNSLLAEAAKAKGEHMVANDYWAHIAPDGTQPWKFFTDVGYKYRYAGENLARDFSDANSAIQAWMASPTHRENLLSPKYQEIGIAVVEGELAGVETTLVVQLFGTGYVDTAPIAPVAEAGASTQGSVAATTPTTAEPTPSPTPIRVFEENQQIVAGTPEEAQTQKLSLLLSPFDTTKSVSIFTIGTLLVILVVDALVVRSKKLQRISGRTFAHFAFLGMILTLVIIARVGEIL